MQAQQTAATAAFVSTPTPTPAPRARQRIATRLATVDDAEVLQKIVSDAYSTDKNWCNQSAYIVDERVTVEELREMIKCGEDALVVAVAEDGELAGCIQIEYNDFHPDLELPDGVALIGMLAVRPEFESMGVGLKLGLAAFTVAARRGCQRVRILVLNKRTDLQRIYERKVGFRRTGETRAFTYGGRVLQSDVHFVVFERDLVTAA